MRGQRADVSSIDKASPHFRLCVLVIKKHKQRVRLRLSITHLWRHGLYPLCLSFFRSWSTVSCCCCCSLLKSNFRCEMQGHRFTFPFSSSDFPPSTHTRDSSKGSNSSPSVQATALSLCPCLCLPLCLSPMSFHVTIH